MLSAPDYTLDFAYDTMSTSPKSPQQWEDIMFDDDEQCWPLIDLPDLSPSLAPSDKDLSRIMPMPPRQSILLPVFQSSTMEENLDPGEFHRNAARLLSGKTPLKRDSRHTDENAQSDLYRQLHCDLGKDPAGRLCCSCGKSYTTSMRLREHVRQCAGTTSFPCTLCERAFDTKVRLDCHVSERHNDNKEVFYDCEERFIAHQLPKDLATGLGGCDAVRQATVETTPKTDESRRGTSRKPSSQQYWIYEGDLSWCPGRPDARDSKLASDDEGGEISNDTAGKTMPFVKQLLERPTSQPSARKACGICGELFNAHGDELALHVGKHSLKFAEKCHKCHECHIYFANAKDLERHLQSADLNTHCGFTFRHNAGVCTGHHPPTYYMSSLTSDHDLMQEHLWSWELCQLETHRLAVASILAERLNHSMNSPMSGPNVRRTYNSRPSHFSVATRDSAHSTVSSDQTSTADSRFSNLISEYPSSPRSSPLKHVLQDRPDSATHIASSRDTTMNRKTLSRTMSMNRNRSNSGNVSPKSPSKRPRLSILDAFKQGHKRTQSGPVGEGFRMGHLRPRSMPTQNFTIIKLVA